ncbi:MAG: hypothetical protein IPK61_05040 [Saprospiraceae bacterium]|nr:hypothetical protein [Saprospiraceae bacterium]
MCFYILQYFFFGFTGILGELIQLSAIWLVWWRAAYLSNSYTSPFLGKKFLAYTKKFVQAYGSRSNRGFTLDMFLWIN